MDDLTILSFKFLMGTKLGSETQEETLLLFETGLNRLDKKQQ
jgi:hypothetical protein